MLITFVIENSGVQNQNLGDFKTVQFPKHVFGVVLVIQCIPEGILQKRSYCIYYKIIYVSF